MKKENYERDVSGLKSKVSKPDKFEVIVDLFKQNKAALIAFAFNLLQNLEDAKDVLQIVFLKMIEMPERNFKNIKSLPDYIFAVIRNECRAFHRENKKRRVAQENYHLANTENENTSLGRQETLENLDRIKPFLDDREFEAISLWCHGAPYKKISEALGDTEDAIRGLLYRIKIKLRKKKGEIFPFPD